MCYRLDLRKVYLLGARKTEGPPDIHLQPLKLWKHPMCTRHLFLYSETLSEFDLIMVTEYMSESLILFRRQMCWDMSDVLIHSINVR